MLKKILSTGIGGAIDYTARGFEYQGNLFTGIEYYRNDQGKVVYEISYFEGIPWGFSRTWSSTGVLIEEYELRDGGVYNIFREWHLNKQLKKELLIEYGITVKRKVWDENGLILEDFSLKDHPEHNHYELWLIGKEASEKVQIPQTIEFENQISSFESEIAMHLLKYPSDKFHCEEDFLTSD
jgi:antitoxin component YwqK of YwqJK toxin-antitoxin module